jgi:aspartate/methionine/tyrosine aminotransferase
LLDAVNDAMRAGHNKYPPMAGVPELRQAISHKIESLYGHHYDPNTEIPSLRVQRKQSLPPFKPALVVMMK